MQHLISRTPWGVLCLACIATVACMPDAAREPGPSLVAAPVSQVAEAIVSKWTRSCALCHVNGEGGAPRMGVIAEWQPRLAQGREVLLKHTIEGFNSMPPLGYCMACERDDFNALIDFMTERAQ